MKALCLLIIFSIVLPNNNSNAQNLQDNLYVYSKIWGIVKYSHPKSKRKCWDSIYVKHVKVLLRQPDKIDSVIYDLLSDIEIKRKSHMNSVAFHNEIKWLDSCKILLSTKTRFYLNYSWTTRRKSTARYWYNKEASWVNRGLNGRLYSKSERNFNPNRFKTIEEESLLGVSKAWNVIEFFYFYKHLTRKNWDIVLKEAISFTLDTSVDISPHYFKYRLAIQKMLASLNDCHALIAEDSHLGYWYWGSYRPDIEVDIRDDIIFISKIANTISLKYGVKVNDTIFSINGQGSQAKINQIRPYLFCKYSNRLKTELNLNILRGVKDSLMVLNVNNNEIKLTNDLYYVQTQKPIYRSLLINDSTAYINFASYHGYDDLLKELRGFNNPKYLIFDYRFVNNGFIDFLPLHFSNGFKIPYMVSYSPNFTLNDSNSFRVRARNRNFNYPLSFLFDKIRYNKIFIIVDGNIQSYLEELTMSLQTFPNVFTLGDTSAAALAEVRQIFLPGNILFSFTAKAAYYLNENSEHRSFVRIDYPMKSYEMDRDNLIEKILKLMSSDVEINTERL